MLQLIINLSVAGSSYTHLVVQNASNVNRFRSYTGFTLSLPVILVYCVYLLLPAQNARCARNMMIWHFCQLNALHSISFSACRSVQLRATGYNALGCSARVTHHMHRGACIVSPETLGFICSIAEIAENFSTTQTRIPRA